MKLPLPPEISLTNEMLTLVSSIDEFKGQWRSGESLQPSRLQSLRRFATIESIGSSTRIEGVKLDDHEVEALLGDLQSESFQTRDEEEVAGYAYVMEAIQTAGEELSLNENILLQLHGDLLRYSSKDERHRGEWKSLPNHVAAFDPDGKQLGIVFETATPFETAERMRELMGWLRREEASPFFHPLLRIAVFAVAFLAIHPFQDGNGRLSRVLTNLLLLQAGYDHSSYSSLESVIEHNKEAYYLALRRTQTSFGNEKADWEPWILFFLRSVKTQTERLRNKVSQIVEEGPAVAYTVKRQEFSPLAEELLDLVRSRRTLSIAEAAAELGANRNTLKGKFSELVEARAVRLCGKGRGAHYRIV